MSKKIIFSPAIRNIDIYKEYVPKPAKFYIPEWYKKTPVSTAENKSETPLPTNATIKQCVPILDSMMTGYIIPLWTDVLIRKNNDELAINASSPQVYFESHPKLQNPNYPNTEHEYAFLKFINPWHIITPKGYSSLIISPLHNPNPWVKVLEGVVDTDTWHEINIPAYIINPNREGVMPAGTPLVQVIPFKRETWKASEGNDKDKNKIIESIKRRQSVFQGTYKRFLWTKKNYS